MGKIISKIDKNNRTLLFKIKSVFNGIQSQSEIEEQKKFNEIQTAESIIKRYFSAYSIWFKFTLRQMEQVFDRLVLFTKEIAASDELFSPDLAVLLACLHEFDAKIYNNLRTNQDIYGQHGGVIGKIYNGGDTSSCAYQTYERKAFGMFNKFDRNIAPKVPASPEYSGIYDSLTRKVALSVKDNVDRFFNIEPNQQNPLKWLYEFHDKNTEEQNNIDTNGVLAHIISHKRDAKWETPEPDINTVESFDLQKFRQNYFSKMDFMSHFIDGIKTDK